MVVRITATFLRIGAALVALSASTALASAPCPVQKEPISFTTKDNITLRGEVLSPCGSSATTALPAVMFINPFGQPFFVYEIQAAALADDGYRVLLYDPRGWQSSDGETTLDYSVLTDDARRAIDWLTTSYSVTRIGATGISEGGGLSLLLAAKEPRLSAVGSLSGWTDLTHSSLGDTPRLSWNVILGTLVVLFGDPYALIEDAIRQAQKPPQDPLPQERKISAWFYLPEINAKKVPVLLTHNLDDTLFPVNQVVDFFRHLEGPRHLSINRGFHAASEITNFTDPQQEPWITLHHWFDDYLKRGKASDLDGAVTIAFKNCDSKLKLNASTWHDADGTNFYLTHTDAGYELSSTPTASSAGSDLKVVNMIPDPSGVTTGIPLLSALANLRNLETVKEPVQDLLRPYAIQFTSQPMPAAVDVDGTPKLYLKILSAAESGLIIAHLVDIGPDGVGSLITHGVYTWNAKDRAPDGPLSLVIQLYTTAWHLEAGHKLGIMLNGEDAEYQPASLLPYEYDLDPQAGSLRLEVPLIKGA